MTETLLKHSRMPRKVRAEQPQVLSKRGRTGLPIAEDKKQSILDDAKAQILAGLTIDQIAEKHGIAPRTLEYWLSAMGDEYQQLRQAWLDGMLIDAGELLKDADDPMRLARARELWKRATWYAERRDRARYGQDQQINVTILDLGDRLRRARERAINTLDVVGDTVPALSRQE